MDRGGRWGWRAVAFSADGKWLASGGWDGRIRVWDRVGFQIPREVDAGSGVEDLAFGGDGAEARLLVGTWQGAELIALHGGDEEEGERGAPVLFPAYPNPFNSTVRLPYRLVEDGRVALKIYDALGQLVRRIDLGSQTAGYYYSPGRAAQWDGRDQRGYRVGSGLYIYELRAGSQSVRRKIAFVQ
jgi:hypothetical protein